MKGSKKRSGFVSLVGRTNVGKSTLINTLIEHKVSITSRKPQTTRFRVLGIKTKENSQAIIIDTPGYHQGHNRVLNKFMNKVAIDTLVGIDVLVFVVEALRWKQEDKALLNKIPKELDNVILVINKIDKVKNKDELLPIIHKLRKLYELSNTISRLNVNDNILKYCSHFCFKKKKYFSTREIYIECFAKVRIFISRRSNYRYF